MGLEIKSYDTLINTSFERMERGIEYDEKLYGYSPDFIQECIDYFKERENYEKCAILMAMKSKREHGIGWK
jgi:hypothetical protein